MGVALVTGGSRGLGGFICEALANAGWAVAVNFARDRAGASSVVERIEAAGGKAILAQFDVTDEHAVAEGIGAIAADLGPVDLIVNNATGPQPAMPLADQNWTDYLGQLEFFVKAPLNLLHNCLADWRRRRSGRIINIGSEIAETGGLGNAHYAAAKGAMVSLTRAWAKELGPEGITVNLIAPGWIPVERHADIPEAERDEYRGLVPLAKLGDPEDIAAAVVFLASPGADFITGQRLAVNGGRTFF